MKLTSDQMTGGTFTISNLGMYGVREFDAILNLPQVGILAVGAAEKRPVVEGNTLVVGTVMTVTLTADHRVVDGADRRRVPADLQGPARRAGVDAALKTPRAQYSTRRPPYRPAGGEFQVPPPCGGG